MPVPFILDALLNTSLDGFCQQDIVFEGDGRQRIIEAPDHWIFTRFTQNY